MKRALSLIIVLAMVLCMIPFSAFAVEEVPGDFGSGYDFLDGVITLPASGTTDSYLLKATEVGTVTIYAEPVIPEVEEGVEVTVPEPYIIVDGEELDAPATIEVAANKDYEIKFADNLGYGGEVTVYAVFTGLPGTETNPIQIQKPMMGNTSITLEPETITWYELVGYATDEVVITGNGVKVSKDGTIYGGPDATEAKIQFANNEMYGKLSIVNKTAETQTYTISTTVKVGTINNPEVVPVGEYQQKLDADNQGYFYNYIAEGDGTVSVNLYAQDDVGNTLGTSLTINNPDGGSYGDETNEGAASVAVSEGDVVEIVVGTYAVDEEGNPLPAPAGTITTVITFTEAEPEPEVGIDWGSVLDGVTSHSNETDAEVFYTYTAEKDGMLYRSDYGFNFLVSAGDPVNIYIAPGETVELYYASPVAKIGDVEYYYFDEAVSSAVAGETIVLLADVVSEWDGISLKPGINLNLGEFTLTAPYVIAFGEVTGVVGSASIVAENVMLNNVTIDGVEYAWTAGEGAYTLVEYKAPTTDDGEPIGDAVAENATTGEKYATVKEALEDAKSGETVNMTSDSDETGSYLSIPEGVTLYIGDNSLTASGLTGYNGSILNGGRHSSDGTWGKVYVPKDALILAEEAPVYKDYRVVPYWYPTSETEGYYLLANIMHTVTQALTIDETNEVISINFRHKTSDLTNALLSDDKGADDNAMQILLRAEWKDSKGNTAFQNFVYSAGLVYDVANDNTAFYTFMLTGYSKMSIDLNTLDIKLMVVTDSGATYSLDV